MAAPSRVHLVVLCMTSAASLVGALQAAPGEVDLYPKYSKEVAKKFDSLGKLAAKASWHKPTVPHHLQRAESPKMHAMGDCHQKVAAPTAAQLARRQSNANLTKASLIAEHPGRDSFSLPGVGGEQELAEGGKNGKVNGQEPLVTVLKDGFFEVGCYFDAMLEFGDKFGNEKDKYGSSAKSQDVSIVNYKDLIESTEQKKISPVVCYEFCRTLPGMVFFGIHNGNECYCTPYFKPRAGDDSNCDVPCEASPTEMCGSAKGKSTIWEMHLCNQGAADMEANLDKAKPALDYFYETATLAVSLADKITESGDKLEDAGGLSGSSGVGGLGMSAKKFAGELNKAYLEGQKAYEELLDAYNTGKGLAGMDFGKPAVLSTAEHAGRTIKALDSEVIGFARKMHDLVLAGYPAADYAVFGDEASGSLAKALESGGEAVDFKNAPHAYGLTGDTHSQAIACYGQLIGAPKVGLGENGCGLACEETVAPFKCVAFASYKVGGSEDLCFLFSEVDGVETFACDGSAALLQKKGGDAPAAGICKVKMSEMATGYKPKGGLKQVTRCFGNDAGQDLPHGTTSYPLTLAPELSVNGRVVLSQP